LSIAPPSNAFCSLLYEWSWSQVRMSLMLAGSNRRGLVWRGRVAVRVVVQQRALAVQALRVGQPVDGGRGTVGLEVLSRRVGRVRVGAEVVVEGHVLLEDHHQVLDRRRRRTRRGSLSGDGEGRDDRHPEHDRSRGRASQYCL
jgi:hypothetical protein